MGQHLTWMLSVHSPWIKPISISGVSTQPNNSIIVLLMKTVGSCNSIWNPLFDGLDNYILLFGQAAEVRKQAGFVPLSREFCSFRLLPLSLYVWTTECSTISTLVERLYRSCLLLSPFVGFITLGLQKCKTLQNSQRDQRGSGMQPGGGCNGRLTCLPSSAAIQNR